jgi:hypothetical protein
MPTSSEFVRIGVDRKCLDRGEIDANDLERTLSRPSSLRIEPLRCPHKV